MKARSLHASFQCPIASIIYEPLALNPLRSQAQFM